MIKWIYNVLPLILCHCKIPTSYTTKYPGLNGNTCIQFSITRGFTQDFQVYCKEFQNKYNSIFQSFTEIQNILFSLIVFLIFWVIFIEYKKSVSQTV